MPKSSFNQKLTAVHEIEIQEPLPPGLHLLDPVKEVAQMLPPPTSSGPPYQHDGLPDFLLGIVDPGNMGIFWHNMLCNHLQAKVLHARRT